MTFPFERPYRMEPYASYFIVRDARGRTVAQGSERTCAIAMGEQADAVQGDRPAPPHPTPDSSARPEHDPDDYE